MKAKPSPDCEKPFTMADLTALHKALQEVKYQDPKTGQFTLSYHPGAFKALTDQCKKP